jgi:hydrogenase maturation factor
MLRAPVDLSSPFSKSCQDSSHLCICCSDQAIPAKVIALLPGGMASVDLNGVIEEVSVDLTESAPGDIVLVHSKVAIGRLSGAT